MKQIFVVFLLLHLIYVTRSEPTNRIFGGFEVKITDHPYMASLQYFGRHFCGAVIYSNHLLLTAAHCLQYMKAEDLNIRIGSTYWKRGGITRKVAALKVHDHYDSSSFANDIAMIRLKYPVSYSKKIGNISVAANQPISGSKSIACGWGKLNSTSALSDSLLCVDVNIISKTECSSRRYGLRAYLRNSMICAGAPNKDSCSGDSGGPLIANKLLVGLTSFGKQCEAPTTPGVYTNVAYFNSWITNTAKSI